MEWTNIGGRERAGVRRNVCISGGDEFWRERGRERAGRGLNVWINGVEEYRRERERAGKGLNAWEGMLEQRELKVLLLWPLPLRKFPSGHQIFFFSF